MQRGKNIIAEIKHLKFNILLSELKKAVYLRLYFFYWSAYNSIFQGICHNIRFGNIPGNSE
jgi:hypothetical protein